MNVSLLSPPIAFGVILAVVLAVFVVLPRLSLRKVLAPAGFVEPYACGEDMPTHMIQPDYGQFFPFAFFFTILHVVALIVTTIPAQSMTTFLIALLYVGGAMAGLTILYRR